MTTTRLPVRSRTTTDVGRPILPILIQVPALTSASGTMCRPRTRRRRLRKEVRYAGLMMMSVVSVGMLLLLLGGARPADRPKKVIAVADATDAERDEQDLTSRITLTFEPLSSTVAANASVPVVFPGYLLPVDGSEESVHAGN